MSKTVKWLLGGIVLCAVLYFAMSFFAVSWLSYFSTPPAIKTLGDKELIQKIKKEYNVQEIERTPAYEREIKQDTATYTLYLYSKDFCGISTDSIQKKSMKIVQEIDKIHLDPKFYKYKLVFCCKLYNPNGIQFQYVRK